MRILGVIIAGGQSLRMGGQEKAFLPLAGQPMIGHVIQRLAGQVDQVVINANGDPVRFQAFNLPVIADPELPVDSPLRGLLVGLSYARSQHYDAVVSVPSDTPFLPQDLVVRLREGAGADGAGIAASRGQDHYLTGIWQTNLVDRLHRDLSDGGLMRVQDWVRMVGAVRVTWPDASDDPFWNINTPEDLIEATRMLEMVA